MNDLSKNVMPTSMTIGERTYDILDFLKGNETSVAAHLGQDDGQYLLDHQQDIPVAFRTKMVFVFMDWRWPNDSGSGCGICWCDNRWDRVWNWNVDDWGDYGRVLRRK